MDAELAQLEQKLDQLIAAHEGLKAENVSLRERVSSLEADNRRLADKLGRAVTRLESLLEQLPET
ncbi:MAG: hypothetical protein HGA47_13490 [Zoogloea sp.]|nr:hypothetical protein [Zoogloea sp.]